MKKYKIYYEDDERMDITFVTVYADNIMEALEKFKQEYAPLDKIDTIFCRWGIIMKQIDIYSISEISEMMYPDAVDRISPTHISSYVYESLFQPEYDKIRMLNHKILAEQIDYFKRERNRLREFNAIVARLNDYIWILEQIEDFIGSKKLPDEFIIDSKG